ncbi:MAG: hypothetical protein KBG98_07425, partial [Desulfobacter sp.]|uniref:hypothetical protein n=1 Tax=Desulfobacter sp. TaxID=2294 RepID=UPI001B4C3BD8
FRMGQSSNQFGIYIQTDRIIGIFSFSKYYRVSTNSGAYMKKGNLLNIWDFWWNGNEPYATH